MRVKDDLGRTLDVPDFPRRVVSLVPSVTETLAAFGLGERLVGVTDWCTEPPDVVARAARVGHVVAPDPEKVAALAPDLVLANAEENREHAVRKLEAAGLPVYVSFPRSVEGALDAMAAFARLTETEMAARPYLEDARAAIEETRRISAGRPSIPYFCAIWKDPWMTANDDTYLADLLRTAGGRNVFGTHAERYPRISFAQILSRRPGLALLPTEPYAFAEKDRGAFRQAAPGIEVCLLDGTLLSWHGIRTAAALRVFAQLLADKRPTVSPNGR